MQGHYGNGFNLRNEYEEDGYDDYKVDGIEDEVDSAEENEEKPKPNKEELEFLKLREQLSAPAFGLLNQSQDRKRTINDKTLVALLDTFGPSQPVISSGVLEESRSIRETQQITSKVSSSSTGRQGVSASASPGS